MGLLEGKQVLVTGGAQGIGQAIVDEFAQAGAQVLYTDLRKQKNTEIKKYSNSVGSVQGLQIDVSEEDQIMVLFSEVDRTLSSLDIVINNAGILLEKPLLETSVNEFDAVVSTNLKGTFLVGRESIRRMVDQPQGGRVINLSSDLGFSGRETYSIYCATKGAINALTKSWAHEFAPKILVNAIAPGPIATDMLNLKNMSPEWRKKEEDIPLQRVGTPQEVSGLALFLAGPHATFITGQIIGPNGGSVMP